MSSEKMKREIAKRLESDSWDRSISSKVESKIKRKRYMAFGGAMSLATAALIVILISGGNVQNRESYTYSSMITSQVDGTYSSVFDDGNDVDNLIDDALSMRY